MRTGVEISPKWLEQLADGKSLKLDKEVIKKFDGKVIAIEAIRAIDAFEAYNIIVSLPWIKIAGEEGGIITKITAKEFLYIGEDGANFSIVFKPELSGANIPK